MNYKRHRLKSLIALFVLLISTKSPSSGGDVTINPPDDDKCRLQLFEIVEQIDKSLSIYPEESLFDLNLMLQRRLPINCTRDVFMETVLKSRFLKEVDDDPLVIVANFEKGSGSAGLAFRPPMNLIELGWAKVEK